MPLDARFAALRQRLNQSPGLRLDLAGATLRESAVLVPLFLRGGEPHLVFTRRPESLRRHGGQISFPGGARDLDDLSAMETALREAHEELGLAPAQVEVLGTLNETPTNTSFRIQPFVGVIPGDVVYRPSLEEIDEVIEAPLRALVDPSIYRVESVRVQGTDHDVHYYQHGPHLIWGATARILRDLLEVSSTLELPLW